MANLPESSTFDAGVYQIETTDAVLGGPSGVTNTPLKNLTNRTKYLKDHVDEIEAAYAPKASPTFTGTPSAPTAAAGTNTTQLATTAFTVAQIAASAAPIVHVGSGGTAHSVATSSAAGFMSATDKSKLDGIAAGAQANSVTSVAGRTGDITLSVSDVSNACPLNGTGASGTWGISINGNAASVTNGVYTSGNQTIGGVKTFSLAPIFSAGSVGVTNDSAGYGARVTPSSTGTQAVIQFTNFAQSSQWSSLSATSGLLSCSTTFAATSFSGLGTGLTGSASGLSIGGNAATSTTATNQSGGTVNATAGTFSTALVMNGAEGQSFSVGPSGDISVTGGSDGIWGLFKSGYSYISLDSINTLRLTSGQEIRLQGNNATSPIQFFDGGGNNLSHIGNNGSYYAGSDASLKENVRPLQYGLSDILKLEPKVYNLISETAIREESNLAPIDRFGLIAQDVDKVLSELVSETEILALDYVGLIPVLINAIKEQNAAIEKLKADVLALS